MNFFKWAKLRVYSEAAKTMHLTPDNRADVRNGVLIHESIPLLANIRAAVFHL